LMLELSSHINSLLNNVSNKHIFFIKKSFIEKVGESIA
jgi:hypothetical protein